LELCNEQFVELIRANQVNALLISCTCIGLDVASGELYAPHGLRDMWEGVLRMNQTRSRPDLFLKKARDYQERWPWLTIVDEPRLQISGDPEM
jgi:hypothetical protein